MAPAWRLGLSKLSSCYPVSSGSPEASETPSTAPRTEPTSSAPDVAAGGSYANGSPAGTSAVAKVVAQNLSNAETVDQAQAAIYTDFCTWEFGECQTDSTSYFCVTEGGD